MKTVLVVDDEFGIAEVLEAILTDEGYRVVAAMNGRHALEQLAGHRPDLVLSDLMMPVMDGAALLGALKQDDRYRGIPVIIMCSLPEAAVADRIVGRTAFLHKPFRIAEVVGLVTRILPP